MYSYITLAIVVLSFANKLHVSAVESELSASLTAPSAILTPTSRESKRFSRLLHDNAAALQFSSISNLSPPISGLPKEFKESKTKNHKKASLGISATNLGRRTLDYDDSESFDENGEPLPRIITQPKPGNEYVYIRQGGIQTDQQQAAAASVTSINRQPISHRVPLTLLRQSNGKTLNISPVFPEPTTGVQVPIFYQNMLNGKADNSDETATTMQDRMDEDVELTTFPSNMDNYDSQKISQSHRMVINVVTSEPRIEVEGTNDTTSSTTTTPSTTTTTSTTTAKTTTTTARIAIPVIPEIKNATSDDLKENLVVQSSRRIGSYPDFEDSPTVLQTSETSSQPARVNVRPASSGKEYEYEYIYYYYDDDDENNGTTKTNATGTAKPSPVEKSDKSKVPSSSNVVSSAVPNEADFDDEEVDEIDLDSEVQVPVAPKAPSPTRGTTARTTTRTAAITRGTTTTTTTTTAAPIPQRIQTSEKFSNGVGNEIDSSRAPKAFQTEKVITPQVDYKIESGDFADEYEYEDEEEQVQVKAKGQPHRLPSDEDEGDENLVSSSTASPIASSTAQDNSVTMTKSHPDSINSPIVLKQSNLLQSVPASKLHPQSDSQLQNLHTSPYTTPTTTTTTLESASEPIPSVRPPSSRFRGSQRIRGDSTHETVKQQTPDSTVDQQAETAAKTRPNFTRGRTPSRRPLVETSQVAQESSDAAPTKSANVRSRFPSRSTTTVAPSSPSIAEGSVPEYDAKDQDGDAKAKESYVRNKAASDLFTFTRLQQAIGSRAPARKDLVKGPVFQKQSNDLSTESFTSSEATTIPSVPDVVHPEELTVVSTSTTTTTTTQKPTGLDKLGKQKHRFGVGRGRPTTSSDTVSTSTTEASVVTPRTPSRNRFTGRRKQTTESSADNAAPVVASQASPTESERPRVPNRFASRTRSTTVSPSVSADEKKDTEATHPTASSTPVRRKPIFQGRRRNPAQASQDSPSGEPSQASDPTLASATTQVSEGSSPPETDRRRPGLPNVQRRRPGVGQRIRGGRLGTSSTTTTEVPKPSEIVEQSDTERSPTNENEQVDPIPASSATPAVASPVDANAHRGTTGVLGRLRTNKRPAVPTTTTEAPKPVIRERKPSRLNGILNRRQPATLGSPSSTIAPQKEEAKEGAEETHNNAQEQEDSHKGVVVQVSSSITESEETHHGEEETEPSSTTPVSILNRLKSQRKPGQIFRKRTDHHGE